MNPGEYFIKNKEIECNPEKDAIRICVANTGDRPVQVGSHFHFFEVNRQLDFDREKAFGMRLNIPSGTAVRFEPGEEKEVELIGIGGTRIIYGLNALTCGDVTRSAVRNSSMQNAKAKNFKGAE